MGMVKDMLWSGNTSHFPFQGEWKMLSEEQSLFSSVETYFNACNN